MVDIYGSIVESQEFCNVDISQMYKLFSSNYLDVCLQDFEKDLYEKDYLLLLKNELGDVVGFSSIQMIFPDWDPTILLLFSGNTIISPKYWGSQELVKIWARLMRILSSRFDKHKMYWYLICSGYRTYLYLPVFFKNFYPNCKNETPLYEKQLIDNCGLEKFPSEYENGVVHVAKPRECLREEIAIPSEAKLKNKNIEFFLNKNPGYLRGDELVCIAEIIPENFRRLLLKYYWSEKNNVQFI